jgi:DNA modification methylase
VTEPVIIGNATLYLGDCREILPTLPKVDAVITDPPYGVNLGEHRGANDERTRCLVKAGYASYDDTEENFVAIVAPAIVTALALAERGIVFCADRNMWHLPRATNIGAVYLPAGCGRNSWGFASLAHCLMYGGAPDLHKGAKATAIRSGETADKNGHPCPKPIGWMRWAIDLGSRRGETVLDPFMGSGTTGAAAVQMGRKFVGIEVDPGYFEMACRSVENALRQETLFPAGAPEQDKQEALL